jgi:hypothetical protein
LLDVNSPACEAAQSLTYVNSIALLGGLMSELESLRRTIGAVTHFKDLFHNWVIDCHYRRPTFVFVNLENGNGHDPAPDGYSFIS